MSGIMGLRILGSRGPKIHGFMGLRLGTGMGVDALGLGLDSRLEA